MWKKTFLLVWKEHFFKKKQNQPVWLWPAHSHSNFTAMTWGRTLVPQSCLKCILNGNNEACWVIDAIGVLPIPMQPRADPAGVDQQHIRQAGRRMWPARVDAYEETHAWAVP